ncbi:MAG: ABC transporter permease [Planctomycetota bacterium]
MHSAPPLQTPDHSSASTPSAGPAAAGPQRDVTWPAVTAIAWREVVRFLRQRNRVVAAVATPLVFWLLLGFGLNEPFRAVGPELGGDPGGEPGAVAVGSEVGVGLSASSGSGVNTSGGSGGSGGGVGYLEYFFPGMVVMVVLFTSIFSTISVIDDRNNGFLQGVLASPAKRWAIVLGKVLGGALIATLHGLVLLPLWCVFFHWPGLGGLGAAVAVMFVTSVGLTALGLWFAWPMDSTSGYHAVMNLVQFPMWFLCGAVFPLATAGALKWVMLANPLTYGHATLASALSGRFTVDLGVGGVPWAAGLGVVLVASVAMVTLATQRACAVRGD